ncbi:SubName: Full=Uncharacterized protein {ECO:0000313/EMBL:CCA70872.1} [Serendipita indica DSM 11827]|nr:SubName: Full=Uncharacterized protein {ECO:0000313/EMBL:CCA70872.1} [Serendipita indica DSM 11827]
MGATPISDKGPARGGSASKYSPSSSPTLRLSPTAFSPAISSDVPLSASFQVKLAITATCSHWRKIGLPDLFRNVTFTSLHQLQLLTGIVHPSQRRYVPGPYTTPLLLERKGIGHGALIQRIETIIDLGKYQSDDLIYGSIMSELLKCCPKLRIYVNKNPRAGNSTPLPIINALGRSGGGGTRTSDYFPQLKQQEIASEQGNTSLEHLEWSGKEGILVGDLNLLLPRIPYLRRLVLGDVFLCFTRFSDTHSTLQISLLHLTSLRIDLTTPERAYIRYNHRWCIPTLQSLEALVGPAPWDSDLYGFLEHLPPLREFHLRVLTHTIMPPQIWHELFKRMKCSTIRVLTFNVSDMPVLPTDIELPNISQVFLEGCTPDFRAKSLYDRPESDRKEQLSEHFTALARRCVTLRCIRMLDDEFLLMYGRNVQSAQR